MRLDKVMLKTPEKNSFCPRMRIRFALGVQKKSYGTYLLNRMDYTDGFDFFTI